MALILLIMCYCYSVPTPLTIMTWIKLVWDINKLIIGFFQVSTRKEHK